MADLKNLPGVTETQFFLRDVLIMQSSIEAFKESMRHLDVPCYSKVLVARMCSEMQKLCDAAEDVLAQALYVHARANAEQCVKATREAYSKKEKAVHKGPPSASQHGDIPGLQPDRTTHPRD